jgi:predicted NACHT family NTPase
VVGRELKGNLARLNAYTPFFVRLRDFNDRDLPRGNELVSSASRTLVDLVPHNWVRDILEDGKAIFLVDGLDEITAGRYPLITAWLAELLEVSVDSYFIVTTRPASLNLSFFRKNEFAEYSLQRMSPKEIRTFVDYWHAGLEANSRVSDIVVDRERRVNEIATILSENRSLARLASSPLLCAIICTLNFKARLRIAASRTDLYRTAVRLLIHESGSLR